MGRGEFVTAPGEERLIPVAAGTQASAVDGTEVDLVEVGSAGPFRLTEDAGGMGIREFHDVHTAGSSVCREGHWG